MHFHGHFPGGRRAGTQEQTPPPPFHLQLLHIVPIVLIILMTFFNRPGPPVFSLDHHGEYVNEIISGRFKVPYYVKSHSDYDMKYPPNTYQRFRMENDVELMYKERLEGECSRERKIQTHIYYWEGRKKASAMPLPHCEKLKETFGSRQTHTVYAY
eukprot:jgi/Botrbrau1/7454/Bobra.0083s0021.1